MEVTARDKILEAGYMANMDAADLSENPYDYYAQFEQYLLWEQGWWQGFNDEGFTEEGE